MDSIESFDVVDLIDSYLVSLRHWSFKAQPYIKDLNDVLLYSLAVFGAYCALQTIMRVMHRIMSLVGAHDSSGMVQVPIHTIRLAEYVATKEDMFDLDHRIKLLNREIRQMKNEALAHERPIGSIGAHNETRASVLNSNSLKSGNNSVRAQHPCASLISNQLSKRNETHNRLGSSSTVALKSVVDKENKCTESSIQNGVKAHDRPKRHPCADLISTTALRKRKITTTSEEQALQSTDTVKAKKKMKGKDKAVSVPAALPFNADLLKSVKLRPVRGDNEVEQKQSKKRKHPNAKSTTSEDVSSKGVRCKTMPTALDINLIKSVKLRHVDKKKKKHHNGVPSTTQLDNDASEHPVQQTPRQKTSARSHQSSFEMALKQKFRNVRTPESTAKNKEWQ